MIFTVDIIVLLTFVLLLLAIAHYFEYSDEFLFLPVLFFTLTGIFRYNAVTSGEANWAVVAYAIDIFDLNDELGLEALNYFFMGTAVFVFAYFFFTRSMETKRITYDNMELFSEFLELIKKRIIYLFVIILIISFFAQGVLNSANGQIAYGMSYFYLFQLAIGGAILLMYLVFDKASFKTNSNDKMLYGAGIAIAAYLSYNPSLRFQFLSWMLALAIFSAKGNDPISKIKFYLIGGLIAITVFSMAGNARHTKFNPLSLEEKIELAITRVFIAEDLNMLDGFMMVLQVYPEHLDYHYGTEHLEILMRPIPRSIWPGKPVGGYANKLGLNDNMKGTTVGISQTIYGSFFGEGGVLGIIIFSCLYAMLFVRIFQYAYRFQSPVRFMIKGIAIASWVPLLRGGDIPGIYAFIGMSFWPVFLFIYLYLRYIKKQLALSKFNNEELEMIQ